MYPTNEETFDARNTPEWIRQGHLNAIQQFLKRIQDFLGYGGRLHDKTGLVFPVGGWIGYGGLTAPSGWLLCNGREYLRAGANYIDLFEVLGTKYGTRTSSYFSVPDFRGYCQRGYSKIPTISFVPGDVQVGPNAIIFNGQEFNRDCFPVRFSTDDTLPAPLVINTTYYTLHAGADLFQIADTRAKAIAQDEIDLTTSGVGTSYIIPFIEEDASYRLHSNRGSGSGEDLGSYQPDSFQGHKHLVGINDTLFGRAEGTGDYYYARDDANDFIAGNNPYTSEPISDGLHGEPRTAIETRVRNVNTNYIIKR